MADGGSSVERRCRMTRLRAGDYLLPSNDGTTLWRLHTHEDGRAHGLTDARYERRTFWRLVWMPMERAERQRDLALTDPWDGTWTEAGEYLPTRRAAIDLAMSQEASS